MLKAKDCLVNKNLSQNPVILADGAMGSYLLHKGVLAASCLEELNLTDGPLIQDIHRDYLRAGAQLLSTHTFGANPLRLKSRHLAAKMAEINRRAADNLYRVVKDRALMAGNIGPTGLSGQERAALGDDLLTESYHQQAECLYVQGIRIFLLETFTHADELDAAIAGCARAGSNVSILASFTPVPRGDFSRTDAVAAWLKDLSQPAVRAVGMNCIAANEATGPIGKVLWTQAEFPLLIRPNAGIPTQRNGRWIYPLTPKAFAKDMEIVLNAGARIVGGCCGTTPEHIRELARAATAT